MVSFSLWAAFKRFPYVYHHKTQCALLSHCFVQGQGNHALALRELAIAPHLRPNRKRKGKRKRKARILFLKKI